MLFRRPPAGSLPTGMLCTCWPCIERSAESERPRMVAFVVVERLGVASRWGECESKVATAAQLGMGRPRLQEQGPPHLPARVEPCWLSSAGASEAGA